MKNKLISFLLILSTNVFAQREFYELRTYDLKWGTSLELLNNYLKNALLPALNRKEVNKIGVFEEIGNNSPNKIYVLIPYASMDQYQKIYESLPNDKNYINDSKEFNSIPYDKVPYSRYNFSHFLAFEGFQKILKPKDGMSIYELRSYESPSDDAYRRKVKMFNNGEFEIFTESGLRSVFYGEKISGNQMPILTYMLVHESMELRRIGWENFMAHPDWKKLSSIEEYKNTVSNIIVTFLKPLAYSQL